VFGTPNSRRDFPGRTILALALLLSVLIHVTAGGVWSHFGSRIAAAVARVMPRPKPTPDELAAISDAITISRRTVPHASRRAQPAPQPVRPSRPQPRRVAVVVSPAPVPTERPTVEPTVRPTAQPTRVPTPPPVPHATVHLPRPVPTVRARTAPQRTAHNALSPQQIAALQSQFQQTIAQTHGGPTDVAPQKEAPSARRRFDMVMKGTQRDLLTGQGQCYATATPLRMGPVTQYYMACEMVYSDGFTEHAIIPWPMRFPVYDDPIREGRVFHTAPPPDYVAPQDPPLSRLVCIYLRRECLAEIARLKASGGTDAP
jgi:hypothetical protein